MDRSVGVVVASLELPGRAVSNVDCSVSVLVSSQHVEVGRGLSVRGRPTLQHDDPETNETQPRSVAVSHCPFGG